MPADRSPLCATMDAPRDIRALASLVNRYGDFWISHPLSAAMQDYLARYATH